MSEETLVNPIAEPLEDRVENLAKIIMEIDEDYALLHKKINDEMSTFQDRIKHKVEDDLNEIKSEVARTLAELHEKFVEKVQERIQAVSSGEIAAALAKTVLVVRPASREEAKSADTLKIRQATPAEIRNQN